MSSTCSSSMNKNSTSCCQGGKRALKRKHSPYDYQPHFTNYHHHHQHHHESDGGDGPNQFSWSKFLRLSMALHLVSILSLKYNVINVHYPDKRQVSHVMLLIPRLCKQTVFYTLSLVASPLRRSYSDADAVWLKYIAEDYIRYIWRASKSRCSREVTKRHLLHLLWLIHFPLIPLKAVIVRPARYAFKRFKIPRSLASGTKSFVRANRGWQVTCYRMMPLKSLSHAWGFINSINLPICLRPIILNLYVKTFGCNLSEAEFEDLTYYKNLGEFFRRSLKGGLRPIDGHSPLVSPVDGRVLNFGVVEDGVIEQVKGVTYLLTQFLGPPTWTDVNKNKNKELLLDWTNCEEYTKSILHHPEGTSLFHAVIYLAPGDYHRFHSPVEWDAGFRRHFAGELLSVNPKVANLVSGLFSLNERAVYTGSWEHGFFSFTAVGATNVGSIRVYDDPELETNVRRQQKGQHYDKAFGSPLRFNKGQNIGEFNLGSTVILIFEAPSDFRFALEPGQRVKVGESILLSPTAVLKETELSSISERF